MKIIWLIIFSLILICPQDLHGEEKLNVTVSIPPVADIVKNIGGKKIRINTLISPGDDAHSYDPRPSEIIAFGKSDLYFISNIEFENNLIKKIRKIKPDIKIIDIGKKIEKIRSDHKCSDHHNHQGHNHLIEDVHIWNSFENIKIMAEETARVLCENSPENKKEFTENLKKYLKRVEVLHNEIKVRRKNRKTEIFMVFHPSWNYFARDLNLTQIAVETDEKEPGPKDMKELIDYGRKNGIKTIIISPNFGSVAPKIIARAIGADLREVNPLPGNILEELRKLSEIILK